MKYPIIITTLLLYLSASAQEWREDTLNLKGSVKSLHHQSGPFDGQEFELLMIDDYFEYNVLGFVTLSYRTNGMDGEIYEKVFREFNHSNELCISEKRFYGVNDSSSFEFEYGANGLTKNALYYSGNRHWSTFNYRYNKRGLLIEYFVVIEKDNDTIRSLYNYDEFGRKIGHHYISGNKHDTQKINTWKYDAIGQLVEEKLVILNPLDKIIVNIEPDGSRHTEIQKSDGPYGDDSYILRYEYNQKGQICKKTKTDLDGGIIFNIELSYNENNNPIKEVHSNTANNQDGTLTYYYEYDKNGNWTSKTTYWNGIPDFRDTRLIEYY